jgi:UDP-N-acetylmuramate--alanine ligase
MLEQGHYHFTGVAGCGMSSLAQAVLREGLEVSGSDRQYDAGANLDVIRKLAAAGVRFVPQDGSGVGDGTRCVVVSTAIEADNPDLLAAAARAVPVLHRAELLARVVESKRCVAVTGTSGKSTVTGMIGWLLEALGADPTIINGAVGLNWRDRDRLGNFRPGLSEWCVFEADESDRSLLRFRPDWAVVTGASRDHFDLDETRRLFRSFENQAKEGLVSVLREPELLDSMRCEVTPRASRFEYREFTFEVPLPGRHNAENAFLAATLCERLGFDLERAAQAMPAFKGLQRRLELIGQKKGITVIDDYAHNPAKIRAAWTSVAAGAERVHAVWRPHGYGPLKAMLPDLVRLFLGLCRAHDSLCVLPVYEAGGTADRSVNSSDLVAQLTSAGLGGVCTVEAGAALELVAASASPGDAVLVMGARDPGLPALARRIVDAL